jgi:LCP family protein required for cell wall assembly
MSDPDAPEPPEEPPQYTVYRSRPRLLTRREPDELGPIVLPDRPQLPAEAPKRRKPVTFGRVVKWLAIGLAAWVGFSLLLFLISAQIEQSKVSDSAESALDGGGFPLTSAGTILFLGSDQRTEKNNEPGSSTSGPSRSDSIMLMRVGPGHSARLSIPRDTVVNIPGHGQDKINAAYAIGGPALAVTTVKEYLGIKINHLVEVNFENFPKLIDALGGIDYTGGCVVSKINGGFKNGGYTLRLKAGTHHLDGKQALALSRTRKNECRPNESDLTRARRQQKVLAAIKDRVTSFSTFVRLPWVSWEAPKAIRTDMSGPTLLGLFGSMSLSGAPDIRVLKPSGGVRLPDGGAGLTVSEDEKRREVKHFLAN